MLLSLTRRATRVFVVATTSGFIVAGVVLGAHATIAATETIGCLVAYAQVVSSEASAARATFAAVTCLAARTVDHRSSPLNTLALSATCLLAASPLLVLDTGFLLTFGATLGILIGVPCLRRNVESTIPRWAPSWRCFRWLPMPSHG